MDGHKRRTYMHYLSILIGIFVFLGLMAELAPGEAGIKAVLLLVVAGSLSAGLTYLLTLLMGWIGGEWMLVAAFACTIGLAQLAHRRLKRSEARAAQESA